MSFKKARLTGRRLVREQSEANEVDKELLVLLEYDDIFDNGKFFNLVYFIIIDIVKMYELQKGETDWKEAGERAERSE